MQSSPTRSTKVLAYLFWAVALSLMAYLASQLETERLSVQLVGVLIAILALVPAGLWCLNRGGTLPVFPPVAVSFIPTYALPLVISHPAVGRYDPSVAIQSGLTTAGLLAIATLSWYLIVRAPVTRRPEAVLALNPQSGIGVLYGLLSVACLFEIGTNAGWLNFLSMSVYSFVRSASLAFGTLSVVGLSHSLGSGSTSRVVKVGAILLIGVYLICQTVGLYLSAAMMSTLVGAMAYTTAARRPPLVWIGLAFVAVFALQPGKSAMRGWRWANNAPVTPVDYPEFFRRWAEASIEEIELTKEGKSKARAESGTDRASIIHMLMLVQSKSPDDRPFLEGASYAHIPSMFVPRVFDPDKPLALEGQYVMCIHYGLQTREQALRTAVAFGMPAEAYANFGYPGVFALGLLLGVSTGLTTRWCHAVPTLSLRALFGFVLAGVLVNGERSLAIVVTSTFQAGVILLVTVPLIMTRVELTQASSE